MLDIEKIHRDTVAIVTLNNLKKHNTLTRAFWPDFKALLVRLVKDGVRSIVLTGAGNHFCVGGDLESFSKLKDFGERRSYMAECITTFEAMEKSNLLIIAAVNGLALGGGCELAFASDLVIASSNAEFGLPEANFGLMPGFGAFRGAHILGGQWAKYLICAGQKISAAKAEKLGFVLEVVDPSEVVQRATEIACQISDRAPLAVSTCKAIINRDLDGGGFAHSIDVVAMLQGTEDTAEGVRAFLEKRNPHFQGK